MFEDPYKKRHGSSIWRSGYPIEVVPSAAAFPTVVDSLGREYRVDVTTVASIDNYFFKKKVVEVGSPTVTANGTSTDNPNMQSISPLLLERMFMAPQWLVRIPRIFRISQVFNYGGGRTVDAFRQSASGKPGSLCEFLLLENLADPSACALEYGSPDHTQWGVVSLRSGADIGFGTSDVLAGETGDVPGADKINDASANYGDTAFSRLPRQIRWQGILDEVYLNCFGSRRTDVQATQLFTPVTSATSVGTEFPGMASKQHWLQEIFTAPFSAVIYPNTIGLYQPVLLQTPVLSYTTAESIFETTIPTSVRERAFFTDILHLVLLGNFGITPDAYTDYDTDSATILVDTITGIAHTAAESTWYADANKLVQFASIATGCHVAVFWDTGDITENEKLDGFHTGVGSSLKIPEEGYAATNFDGGVFGGLTRTPTGIAECDVPTGTHKARSQQPGGIFSPGTNCWAFTVPVFGGFEVYTPIQVPGRNVNSAIQSRTKELLRSRIEELQEKGVEIEFVEVDSTNFDDCVTAIYDVLKRHFGIDPIPLSS